MSDPGEENPAKGRFPNRFQRKTCWIALTAVAIVVIGVIAVGGITLMTWALSYLQPVLVPIAVAGIIAYLLEPLIRWLQKRGWGHRRAMLTVFSGFMLVVIVLVVGVMVPAFGQASEFLENLGDIEKKVTQLVKEGYGGLQTWLNSSSAQKYYDRGAEWLSEEGPQLAQKSGVWLWNQLRGAFGFFGYLVGFFLVPIYLFYFLKESHHIDRSWSKYLPLRDSEFKDEVVETLQEVNQYLISFFRGQMVVSLIDGALVAIALAIIGVPYALLIGVFLAILGLIPYIGNIIVMVPAVLIAMAHFGATETGPVVKENADTAAAVQAGQVATVETTGEDGPETVTGLVKSVSEDGRVAEVLVNAWHWLPQVWAYPLIVLAIFITLQQVNGLVTAPKIVGDSVGLHPLTVIFSVLFWSLLLGGLLGALLAVPLTASVKVLFRRYIWKRRLAPAVESRFQGARGRSGEEGTEIEEVRGGE